MGGSDGDRGTPGTPPPRRASLEGGLAPPAAPAPTAVERCLGRPRLSAPRRAALGGTETRLFPQDLTRSGVFPGRAGTRRLALSVKTAARPRPGRKAGAGGRSLCT